jgi:hypothetical protein
MSLAAFQKRHPGLVWSNSRAGDSVWIRAALMEPRFSTLLDACLEFGMERVRHEWAALKREPDDAEVAGIASEVDRILKNITEGFADAQAGH